MFLDLFDPLDSLCGCGLEGANHESAKDLQRPKPMPSAGTNSCYTLLLAPCSSVFLETVLCRLGFLAEGLAKNSWVLVYSSERNWLGHFPE